MIDFYTSILILPKPRRAVYNHRGSPDYNVVQLEDTFLILKAGRQSGALTITAEANCNAVAVGEPCDEGTASATWTIVPRWQAAILTGVLIAAFLNIVIICTSRRVPAYCDLPAICDALGAKFYTTL